MRKAFVLLILITASSMSGMEADPQASVAKDPDQVNELFYQVNAEKKELDGILRDEDKIVPAPVQMNYLEIVDPYQPDPNDPQLWSTELYFAVDGINQKSPELKELSLDRYVEKEEYRLNRELISFLPHWYTVQPKSKYDGCSIRNDIERSWFKFILIHRYSFGGILKFDSANYFPYARLKTYLMRIPGIVEVSLNRYGNEKMKNDIKQI